MSDPSPPVTLVGKFYIYSPDDELGLGTAAGKIVGYVEAGYYLTLLYDCPEAYIDRQQPVQLVVDIDYLQRLWLFDDEDYWFSEWESSAAAARAETNSNKKPLRKM